MLTDAERAGIADAMTATLTDAWDVRAPSARVLNDVDGTYTTTVGAVTASGPCRVAAARYSTVVKYGDAARVTRLYDVTAAADADLAVDQQIVVTSSNALVDGLTLRVVDVSRHSYGVMTRIVAEEVQA